MILGYTTFWIHYLKDIDIKSYEWAWCDEYWKNEVRKNIVKLWLEKDKRKPRGFIAYRFVPDGDKIVIRILKLAVHPSWRGKGIGTALLNSVIASAKVQNVDSLTILLHEENVVGREWIMRRGFKAIKLHRKFFPDGRDGYSFIRKI